MGDNNPTDHHGFMVRAIEEAEKCVSEEGKISPKVGAVLVKDGVFFGSAHRGELSPGDHAEFTLLEKKFPGIDLTGATVYTTLEPCTTRNPPKTACAKWLTDRKIGVVVIGTLDPDPRIYSNGLRAVRDAGMIYRFFPCELRERLEKANADFIGKFSANANSSGTATFNYTRNDGVFTIGHGDILFETRWGKRGGDSIYARSESKSIQRVALAAHARTFEEVVDASIYDMSSRTVTASEGEIVVFKNVSGHYALVKVVDVKYKGKSDDRDEITIEFRILDNRRTDFSKQPDDILAEITGEDVEPEPIEEATADRPAAVQLKEMTAVSESNDVGNVAFKSFLEFVRWPTEPEIVREGVESISRLSTAVHELPGETRMVLAEAIKRSAVRTRSQFPMAAICRELELVLHFSPKELKEHVAILERMQIASIGEDGADGLWKVFLHKWPTDWNVWRDLQQFCESIGKSVTTLIIDERFDYLT